MPSTIAPIIAVTSATNVAILAANRERKKNNCLEFMNNYVHQKATVEEQQSYAHCVNIINPIDISGETLFLKASIIVVLLFTIIGALLQFKNSSYDRDFFFGTMMGTICGLVTMTVLAMILYLFL